MPKTGIRIVDIVWYTCLGLVAWALLLMVVGCGTLDNIDTIAGVARDAQEQSAVIQKQADDGDWFGLTESILIGVGGLVAAFGGKKGYDKLKNGGKKVGGI
jgi:hypothetical protein